MTRNIFTRAGRSLVWFFVALSAALAVRAENSETEIRYLSGKGPSDAVLWDFYLTEGRNSGKWTKIRVPSCWEQEGFGSYVYGRNSGSKTPPNSNETGKYRTTFTAPAEWSGRVVRIVFEGAMTDTDVWVNGKPAGPTHQGGFYQFKHDITSLIRSGETNTIEVSVRRDSANESVNRAERWGDYWNFSGIFRPVYLEILPKQFIDRIAIKAEANGAIDADVFLAGAVTPGARVTAQVEDRDGRAVGAPLVAEARDGGATHVSGKIDHPALWSAEKPNLYHLRVTLEANGVAAHTVRQRFGFRTLEVRRGEGFFLNGQRIVLKGANRHSFWPETGRALDPVQNVADIRLMQEMNMNAVRMSHYPPDQNFLDACDELGLYVLDELAGWQNSYDTPTGRRLIGQMMRRDVNHPSILFWDNGNEGGWNTENDDEFAKWDPQQRPVLHPWELFRGITTRHYRKYDEHVKLLEGPDIYMPTEFLHGLYDGGIGAGMWDYWQAMKVSRFSAGGFFWALVDEGVARTDQYGRIDNQGNSAPDGIVGPHREKEGSFFTVKELWSPVQVRLDDKLPADFNGHVYVENNYAFTNLNECSFTAKVGVFPVKNGFEAAQWTWTGETKGPNVEPGRSGALAFQLPDKWRDADIFAITANDPSGRELWTWTWLLQSPEKMSARLAAERTAADTPKISQDGAATVVEVGDLQLRFDRATGRLANVKKGKRELPLRDGPRLAAFRREDRSFLDVSGISKLVSFDARVDGSRAIVDVRYDGLFKSAHWEIGANGVVSLDFEYEFAGPVNVLGVNFALPDVSAGSIQWLGKGPYRVWQNRLRGAQHGVWSNDNLTSIPGELYHYPEFPGYFQDWRWARIHIAFGGDISVAPLKGGSYLGLLKPLDGRGGLYDWPEVGLGVFEVIPAIRSKFQNVEELGPQSRTPTVSGVKRGAIQFTFD